MAGIEKICELSSDYPGGDMYAWKRNSIQVCPQYREQFKGRQHTLYVWVSGMHGRIKRRNAYKWGYEPKMTLREYGYCLYVPSLPGRVRGEYINWSYDLRAVKHHLRKILGLRSAAQLNIVFVEDEDAYEKLIGLPPE